MRKSCTESEKFPQLSDRTASELPALGHTSPREGGRDKNFATKNRRERELEPQLTLGAPRSQTRQRGCDHANQDRPWPLSKCKALLALLSLDGHSHGGKRKVNLNRATTQAKREHKNKFENLCAILEMVNSKS